MPVGLVAIWGKPENEIPEGWHEYVPLRGIMPIGHDPEYTRTNDDPEDYRLNTLNQKGGKRSHKLTEAEMPSHHHQQGSESLYNRYGGGRFVGPRNWQSGTLDACADQNTSTTGGDQPHNNMPPYRVVQFIEYVGFQVAP